MSFADYFGDLDFLKSGYFAAEPSLAFQRIVMAQTTLDLYTSAIMLASPVLYLAWPA